MITKKKKCSRCLEYRYIYKAQGRERYCQTCWFIIEPPKKIKKESDKRRKDNTEYSKLRKKHLQEHPNCQVVLCGCLGIGTDIHHLYSGCDREKFFLDITTWLTVCRSCHSKIHDILSTEELISLGLRKLDRNGEEQTTPGTSWGFNPEDV